MYAYVLCGERAHNAGDLSLGPHPFPFRTRKLSRVEPMVLLWGRVGCRQRYGRVYVHKVSRTRLGESKKARVTRGFLATCASRALVHEDMSDARSAG